ncbi:thiamine pathway transporter thi73 [Kluyveromyces marxianus]|nr:thiamine pathway transporter thi73 [Kluyveromyces marxianus]
MSSVSEFSSSSLSEEEDVARKFLRQRKECEDLKGEVECSSSSNSVTQLDEKNTFFGTHELPSKVLRKLDLFVLPFLCLTYLFMFLDKALLNYAASMGIKKHLKGDEFSNLGTIFSASYIFAEPIASFLLQRYPVSRVFGGFIIVWGIVLACHCACKSYASLMIVRVLLGMFESCSAVGCITVNAMYYTKSEQAQRIGYWAAQAGTGYIIGGLMSFGFLHYHGKEFTSWQIMFLVVGLVTIVFGLCTLFYLPDNVTKAWFFTEEEKAQVIEHIRSNQTGLETKKIKMHQVRELLLHDKLTWPMLLLTGCSQISTGSIGTFSVTITGTFGFDSYQTALLQLPIGAVTIMIIIITTQLIGRFSNFTWITTSMFIPAIIGCIVMIALPLSNKIGNLLSLYLLYSGSCTITNIYIWNTCNTSGYTKRLTRNALTMIVYNISCIVAPQMFREYSYPRYIPAKISLLVTQCVCVPLQLYIGYISYQENRKRDLEQLESQTKPAQYQFLDQTDIENRTFRYIY